MVTKDEKMAFVLSVANDVRNLGGSSFFVGGYVRDELLHRKNDDIDVEIYGIEKSKLEEILKTYGKVRIVGEKFGVYQVDNIDIDFSLPRRDSKVGLKHTDFEVVIDTNLTYKEATSRRDFTINALMKNVLTGEYIDEHDGLKDLENKIIRHVSDEHFAEDPLRVLRAARFASQLGFSVADETIELCKTVDLKDLSAERILKETDKALMSPNPSRYFKELAKAGQLSYWFETIDKMQGLIQNKNYHAEKDVFEHTMMVIDTASKVKEKTSDPKSFMYATLCHDFGKVTKTDLKTGKAINHELDSVWLSEQFLEKIKSPLHTIKYVKSLVGDHMKPGQLYGKEFTKPVVAMFDKSPYREDLKWVSYSDQFGMIDGPKITNSKDGFLPWYDRMLERYDEWLKLPHLAGKDLIELGVIPGKQYSELLNKARNIEYSLVPFDQEVKMIASEANVSKEKLDAYLSKRGYDIRSKEEKFLDELKEKDLCKDLNPSTYEEIFNSAMKQLSSEFKEDKTCMTFDEYVEERTGDLYKKIKGIEKSLEIKNAKDRYSK